MDVQLAFAEVPDDHAAFDRSRRLLVTVREAGNVLSIGRSTVYELIAAGELEVVHIGRSCRVPVAALELLVDRLRASEARAPGPRR
jgi:excisionase family DNA binding protein